jgi:hypothetical protein
MSSKDTSLYSMGRARSDPYSWRARRSCREHWGQPLSAGVLHDDARNAPSAFLYRRPARLAASLRHRMLPLTRRNSGCQRSFGRLLLSAARAAHVLPLRSRSRSPKPPGGDTRCGLLAPSPAETPWPIRPLTLIPTSSEDSGTRHGGQRRRSRGPGVPSGPRSTCRSRPRACALRRRAG